MACFVDIHGKTALFRIEREEWMGLGRKKVGEGKGRKGERGNCGWDIKILSKTIKLKQTKML